MNDASRTESALDMWELRTRCGFRYQNALAEKAGMTAAYVSRLEAGSASPQLGTIRRLAEALSVSPGTVLDALEETLRRTGRAE